LLRVAPPGMDKVFTALSGSDANETAYKAAFMYVAAKRRGGEQFSEEEMASSMENKAPGSPSMSILSFKKAFHGRLFGSLSTTRSKPVHKLDIPAFDWPVADFPNLVHPIEANSSENAREELRCLEQVESILTDRSKNVAAVVVEPIQSEGGDNHASPEFFRGLREITKKHDIVFIVDEVQTGLGATGKTWAHEHWGLPKGSEPDIVTASKKLQSGAYLPMQDRILEQLLTIPPGAWYYSNPGLRPKTAYRQFNTWIGDPVRAVPTLSSRGISFPTLPKQATISTANSKPWLAAIPMLSRI
jgi:4-aminobutyrate aminotransferase/(S)-3-amino-2-methylpropionate transaminase